MARSMKHLPVVGAVVAVVGVSAVMAFSPLSGGVSSSGSPSGVAKSAAGATDPIHDGAASAPVAAISDQACDLKATPALPTGLSDQSRRDLLQPGPSTSDSTSPPLSRDQALAMAVSNSSAKATDGLPTASAELPYRMASNLGGDTGSPPALADGTSIVAPTRCVWVVTVHGTFVPDSGPSDEARLAHTFDTFSVAYDELSGTELWLSAGSSAPDLISGTNLK